MFIVKDIEEGILGTSFPRKTIACNIDTTDLTITQNILRAPPNFM